MEKDAKAANRRLPRACQMRRKKDYSRVYAHGVRARGHLILVIAAPSDNPLTARMGLSVGRKFNKSAVMRNRARRVMREAFRLERSRLAQLDLILIPIARDKPLKTAAVAAELRRLVKKLSKRLDAQRTA
ncbi:MAG: ribonuclease P protein component [Planctomycetota bacterium]|nr:ribonuclease P protein component [Planctomycetota bacterium]